MALLKNPFGGNLVGNLAIGIGFAVLTPIVIPLFTRIVRPAAKGAVKGGLRLSELVVGRREAKGSERVSALEGQTGQNETAPCARQGIVRPLAVNMVKSGIVVYEKSREFLSGAEDGIRELVSGARSVAATRADADRIGDTAEDTSVSQSPKPYGKALRGLALPHTGPRTIGTKSLASRKRRLARMTTRKTRKAPIPRWK